MQLGRVDTHQQAASADVKVLETEWQDFMAVFLLSTRDRSSVF